MENLLFQWYDALVNLLSKINFELLAAWMRGITSVIIVLAVIWLLIPKNMLRVLAFLFKHSFIRVREQGTQYIPASGPVLLVSNHISLLDILLIQSISKKQVRFMVRTELLNFLPTRFIFWYLGVIPVPKISKPHEMRRFLFEVRGRLRRGETLCFFPEGSISGNGNLMRFRSGVEALMPRNVEVTVLPMRIGMLHGRLFQMSEDRKLHFNFPKSLPVHFSITVGTPVNPNLTAFQLRQKISEMGAEAEMLPQPDELPIHSAFLKRAKRHPFAWTFADAITGKSASNFKMLLQIVLLSRKIKELDRGENGYIGVLMPNSSVAAALILGVMCADRTPGIINYSAGEEVALESARRAGIKTILTARRFVEKLKWDPSLEMVYLEDVAKLITTGQKLAALLRIIFLPSGILMRRLMPMSCFNIHHQAVLLFSSGTTGKPKGVMLTHRNINCDIYSYLRVIAVTNRDRFVGNLPLFHAFGFTAQFAFPAMDGLPVVYVLNPLSANDVVGAISKHNLTILTATPTFMQNYLRKATKEELKSLRLVVTGAEKLRPELAQKYKDMTGHDIVEGYGCTELSPIACVNFNNSIYDMHTRAGKPGSIGCPLPGIHVRIVDAETGVELGPGKPGRMQVKGGIVMHGYLNAPEQTAKVLLNGYYDTGDIAKLDSDGYVYITGRASRFSKVGGEMVPHEGLENLIAEMRSSECREVAVTGKSDPRRGEKILVFYTPDNLVPAEVIEFLKGKKLPNLWIPKEEDFIHLKSLPLLGSGKLDIRTLNHMAETGDYGEYEYEKTEA